MFCNSVLVPEKLESCRVFSGGAGHDSKKGTSGCALLRQATMGPVLHLIHAPMHPLQVLDHPGKYTWRQSKLSWQLDASDKFGAEMSSKRLRYWGLGRWCKKASEKVFRHVDLVAQDPQGYLDCASTWPSGTPFLLPFLTWAKLVNRRWQVGTVTKSEVPDQDDSSVLDQRLWVSQ